MPGLNDTFGLPGQIERLEGRRINHDDLIDADVLLVRSVTRVNADLLQGTNIRFVGSATIGIDHLDTHWLEANNIAWAHAPGCNANAAAQYTLAMMQLACERLQRDFKKQTVGIIGRGNVGKRLERLLQLLDIPVMACDPPLQEQGGQQLVSMDEACANSIISLHVPLTCTGNYPTSKLFDQAQLDKLQRNTLLVNSSRGGVIEETSLLAQLQSGRLQAALDVWPNEPFIAPELLDSVAVATPHIAGYSREGKLAGTEMIYEAFCNTFMPGSADLPSTDSDAVVMSFPADTTLDEVLHKLTAFSCPVARDDAALRALPQSPGNGDQVQFDSLRTAYPDRREFKSHQVKGLPDESAHLLSKMGFRTV